jgi:hypothetical protein
MNKIDIRWEQRCQTYNQNVAEDIVQKIKTIYLKSFKDFEKNMKSKIIS